MAPFSFFQTVDLSDVRVVERGQNMGLTLEAGQSFGVAGQVIGQDLNGDLAIQFRVAGPVHHAHPAAAEFFQDLVMGDGLFHEFGVPENCKVIS